MSETRLVSVVVIGRNEGARLARCLDSVAAMTTAGFDTECIYVDSGSSDGSVALAQARGARTIRLDAARPTAALGRNAGWRAARGEIVLFLDGDTILAANFVADSLSAFEEAAIAIVWGHRRELYPQRSIYNRVLDLDWIYAPGFTSFCGGDALFRRSVLESTGGFDETLIAGEEPELCRRVTGLGLRILHVDRPMTAHDLDIRRFGQYWRRATRAGHAYAEVSERFRGTADPFWLADARRNRLRALALLTLLALGVLAAAFTRSLWVGLLAPAVLVLLALRTGWKARWKANLRNGDWLAVLLYGLHSQLQQIPIFLGQIGYLVNRRRGRRAQLVEYKRS
jgi:glycosyltransferase involved in cell wall biosynthesis